MFMRMFCFGVFVVAFIIVNEDINELRALETYGNQTRM
jgi:hypothetical protein